MILCNQPQSVVNLFRGWQETMIDSYLQGCMGECYVDNDIYPRSAQILIADFCFFAGIPCQELVQNIKSEFVILVPQNEEWSKLIEDVYGKQVTRRHRYATLKEKDVFDIEYLHSLCEALNPKYCMKMIDETCYHKIITSSYQPFHDLCRQLKTYDDYNQHGLGVVIMDGDDIIAGASSYTYYHEGIEIEIDTHPAYRQQGLATVCGAKLICECLKRNLYPSWDAHHHISLKLAKKLGYRYSHSYPVYELSLMS